VAKLIISISKNGQKKSLKITNFLGFISFSQKKIVKLPNFATKKHWLSLE
jgi:hypothetical protein